MTTEAAKPAPLRTPDTLVILFWVAVALAVLSFVIPEGSFSLEETADGVQRVDIATFELAPDGPPGTPLFSSDAESTGFLNAPFEGYTSGGRTGGAVAIIAFLIVIGGAFGIIMRSGCIDRGIRALIGRTEKDPTIILPLLFVLFSLGGAVFGMSEENIAFVLLLAPIVVRLGFDSITAVLITYVASRIGFATSWMNPFNVAIAQGIADVELFSGAPFRMAMWVVFTAVGLIFTIWYARRVRTRPERSIVYASDAAFRDDPDIREREQARFSGRDVSALLIVLAGIAWVIWGVTVHQYYIAEIASQFFAMGLAVALVYLLPGENRMAANDQAAAFRQGVVTLMPAIIVVGLANALIVLLGGADPQQPAVMNTILFGLASVLGHVPEMASAWLMLMVQGIINFFVPSGSGQAALTMPLMAPLGDLVGVNRQVTVLAFQLGDSLTNLIIPTSATLMGVLGAARIDWAVWARFILPLLGLLVVLALVFLGIAVAIDYQ